MCTARRRSASRSPAKTLLAHAEAIQARLGAAKTDIDALARGTAGPLRIGAYESVSTRLAARDPAALRELPFPTSTSSSPRRCTISTSSASLERGDLDLAFLDLPLPPGPFETTHGPRPIRTCSSRRPAPSRRAPVPPRTLAEFARLPLIVFRACKRIDSLLGQLRAIGLEANVVLMSDYNEAVQGYAAAGPRDRADAAPGVNYDDERTVVIELGDLIPPRQIAMAWHSERTPTDSANALIWIAVEVGDSLVEPARSVA